MNSTTAVRAHDPDPLSSASGPTAEKPKVDEVWKKPDQVFGPGLGMLQRYMRMLSQLAKEQQEQMKKHGDEANEAQKMVAAVDALNAEIDMKGGAKEKVGWTEPLRLYVESHTEWHDEIDFTSGGDEWNKKEFTAVKGVIQKYATQQSDATSRLQMQVQKSMQTYNVTVGLMNSLQTMLGDMTKQFAQAIR